MTTLRVLQATTMIGHRPLSWKRLLAKTLAVASSSSILAAAANSSSTTGSTTTSSTSVNTSIIHHFALAEKWQTSPDSYILRFNLPSELGNKLDLPAPSGVKLVLPIDDDDNDGVVVEKSYSPISHEDTEGYFDLLVKSYPKVTNDGGGGFGAFLCDLQPGETAPLKLKKARKIQGKTGVGRRWSSLTMIGGGTGIAPFVQVVRSILADDDDQTKLRLISVNRREEDILMKKELDELARDYSDRLTVTYILTDEEGRGTVELARQLIPSPLLEETVEDTCTNSSTNTGSTCRAEAYKYEPSEPKRDDRSRSMVMVCGKDGFVGTWAGPLVRIPASPGVKKQKLQGPVGGFLKELGYDEQQVYKF